VSTVDTAGANGVNGEIPGLTRDDLIPDQAIESAEDDALDYMAFVRQLALLVASVDTPVNIALFGPWGSGKSTVGNLLRGDIERNARAEGVRMPFVRYDAWRFAGLSLQRSFISEAAEQLGVRRERYHRRLYQDRRTGGFRPGALVRSLPAALVTFTFVLGAIIALATGLAALAAVVAGKDVGEELKRQAPTLLPVAGLISVFAAIARPFLDAAGTQMSEGAPVAAEQFRVTFERLIADGLKRARQLQRELWHLRLTLGPVRHRAHKRRDRVVFFIDELDRCAPEDVVEALRALKTFLEVENCVFLVAADRDVLESALDRLPQTTPLNEEAPYFSSAASFLDKVFQYQIPLPPLRGGRRLRTFAGELVREPKKGLWRQIQAVNNGLLLDQIVYTLIPSHVRSPRRAKVLLNKFAANARIAEAHQILWMERAEEIAKLTVLQTEFPAVAADLRREPRLPGLLLRPPRNPSPLLALLLERHEVGTSEDGDAIGSGAMSTSYLLAGGGRRSMVRAQRGELRRYLELTATVPDARRDLLFLETGGRRMGLADAQLMDEVETNAPNAPDKVAASVQKLESESQRRLVAEVLLDMSETAVGREKRNVVTALLTTVSCMTDEATQVADRVATAVRIYRAGYELPSRLLAPALRISELQQARTPVRLTDDLLTEGELWSDREGVLEVLRVAATLSPDQLDAIERRIATSVGRWPEILAEAIRGPLARDGEAEVVGPLAWEGVEALLGLPEVGQAVSEVLDERGRTDERAARELADALHRAGTRTLDGRDVSVTAIPLLWHVDSRFAYDAVRRISDRVDPHPGTPEERCHQALLALRRCEPEDWEHWRTGLKRFEGMSPLQAGWAVDGIVAVLRKFHRARVPEQKAAIAIIEIEAELAESAIDEQARTALTAAVNHGLARKWWDKKPKRDAHRRFHAAARALTRAEPGMIAGPRPPEGPPDE
jgi:KAP family P-loop domain